MVCATCCSRVFPWLRRLYITGQSARGAGQSGASVVQRLPATSTRTNSHMAHRTIRCPTPDSPVSHRKGNLPIRGFSAAYYARTVHYPVAPDSPVHLQTEGKSCLPNGAPTAPRCLEAIKGTPRRMEQYTKPPLNILRRLDSANAHLDHRI
jgi:hypothetical protein